MATYTSAHTGAEIDLSVGSGSTTTGVIKDFNTLSGSATSTGSFGYLNVIGDGVIAGNLTFGDSTSDSINFGAEVSSSIIPDSNNKYNLGSNSKSWNALLVNSITASGGISASGNILTYSIGGSNYGTVKLGSNVGGTIDGIATSNDISASGNFYGGGSTLTFGHITASGNISASGAYLGNSFKIQGNILASRHSSGAITLANDSDTVEINATNIKLDAPVTASIISASGNLFATGDLDIDGASNIAGNATFGNDIILEASAGDIAFQNGTGGTTAQIVTRDNGVKINVGGGNPAGKQHLFVSASGGEDSEHARVGIGIDGAVPNVPSMFTVAGDISSSGTITGNTILLDTGANGLYQVGDKLIISSSDDISIDCGDDYLFKSEGSTIVHIKGDEAILDVNGTLDVSSHITSSGAIRAVGEISSSATVLGNQFKVQGNTAISMTTDDAVTFGQYVGKLQIGKNPVQTTLKVQAHITASGNISGSITSTGSFGSAQLHNLPTTAVGLPTGSLYILSGSQLGMSGSHEGNEAKIVLVK